MEPRRLLAVTMAAVLLAATAGKKTYYGYKVFNCLDLIVGQLELLLSFSQTQYSDVWLASHAESRAEIMVAPQSQAEFLAFAEQNGIHCEVMIDNVQETIMYENKFSKLRYEEDRENIAFDKYHSFYKINDYLEQMAATYPHVASVEVIGKSTEGRDLKVIKISHGGGGGNPIIWIDAGIHAREWIAPAMALYVINQLLENPANSALLDGVDWHILPVANPDGYQWSFTKDRFWRKTRSKTSCGRTDRSGVDPNRNWDFHWNAADENDSRRVGSSRNPNAGKVCSETYSGPAPFSEPETAAMRDYLLANKHRLKFYLSLHSFGPYIFTPWAWTYDSPEDMKTLNDLAHAANDALEAVGGEPAQVGSPADLIYQAPGASFDWVRGVAGVNLSYTIELPGGGERGFDLPTDQIKPTVAQYFEVVRVFGEFVQAHFPHE